MSKSSSASSCHEQCLHWFYLEHHRESQIPTHQLFLSKTSTRPYLFKQTHEYKYFIRSQWRAEEHGRMGWHSWRVTTVLISHFVVKDRLSGTSFWTRQRRRGRKDCETPIPLLPLLSIAFPPQKRSPDSQDLVALCHCVTMPKDFKLWGRVLYIDLWEAMLKSGNMWGFESGYGSWWSQFGINEIWDIAKKSNRFGSR